MGDHAHHFVRVKTLQLKMANSNVHVKTSVLCVANHCLHVQAALFLSTAACSHVAFASCFSLITSTSVAAPIASVSAAASVYKVQRSHITSLTCIQSQHYGKGNGRSNFMNDHVKCSLVGFWLVKHPDLYYTLLRMTEFSSLCILEYENLVEWILFERLDLHCSLFGYKLKVECKKGTPTSPPPIPHSPHFPLLPLPPPLPLPPTLPTPPTPPLPPLPPLPPPTPPTPPHSPPHSPPLPPLPLYSPTPTAHIYLTNLDILIFVLLQRKGRF